MCKKGLDCPIWKDDYWGWSWCLTLFLYDGCQSSISFSSLMKFLPLSPARPLTLCTHPFSFIIVNSSVVIVLISSNLYMVLDIMNSSFGTHYFGLHYWQCSLGHILIMNMFISILDYNSILNAFHFYKLELVMNKDIVIVLEHEHKRKLYAQKQ